MPRVPFPEIPDDGRVWIFAADRDLDEREARTLLSTVDRFLDGWKAHGEPLTAAREWRDGRVLLVAVDRRSIPPSGCSIDAMVRVLAGLEEGLGVGLTDHGPIHYRDEGGAVRTVGRAEFRRAADAGEVTTDVPVLDTTLTSVSDVREGKLERPARETWHARAFFRAAL